MEEPKGSVKEDSDADCDVGSDVEEEEKTKEDIGVEEPKSQDQEEKKSSKMKEAVKSKEKPSDIEESIEALEEIASGIINIFSKLPMEDECSLCKEGSEDLKYSPSRRKDRLAALEALALKMLAWKKPDEPLKQRKYAEGYDSLVRELCGNEVPWTRRPV